MREILFRGKRMDNGEWVEGSLIHQTKFYGDPVDHYHILYDGEFHIDYYGSVEVIPETIGEFTGIHDKNGKKIFEGDIVKFLFNYDVGCYPHIETEIRRVIFASGEFTPVSRIDCSSFEILGNIHDNSELLEVKI